MLLLRNLILFGRRMRCKRNLYTANSLGIDEFAARKKKMVQSISNPNDLKVRLRKICNDGSSVVFLDDVKKMLGLAETNEDVQLLFSLLKRYKTQKQVILFEGFKFGPEVIRLFYYLNEPVQALKIIEDEDLSSSFQQYTSCLLLLNLLFENKMYKEVISIYDRVIQPFFKFTTHGFALLYVAACYNLNTPEHFEKACKIFRTYTSRQKPTLRSCLFFAAFSIKNNEPTYAIDALLSFGKNFLVLNYQCMAFAQAKRFDDVMILLKSALHSESSDTENLFLHETLSFISGEIQSCQKYCEEFEVIKGEFEKRAMSHVPLDHFLHSPINWENKTFSKHLRHGGQNNDSFNDNFY